MRLANQNSIPVFKKTSGGGAGNMLDFSGVTDIYAYGDSYTSPGLQATGGGTPAANSYMPLLLATIGKGVTNRADTGRGILAQVYNSLFSDVQPRVRGITCMVGLNDINRNGNVVAFLNFWEHFYRVFLTSNLVTSGTAASDITATSWFNYNHASGYHKAHQFGGGKTPKGTQTLYSGTQELSHTFSGDHVVMQYLVSIIGLSNPATYLDTMEVRIDGVLQDTFDCNVAEDQDFPGWEIFSDFYPRCKVYSGLSAGSHTITVRRTANSGGVGGGIFIDYFGHLGTDTSDTKPILLAHVTYIPNYAQAAPYNNGSDAGVDAMNTRINNLITELKAIRPGLPLVTVVTNEDEPLLVLADWHGDGLHPIDSGHDKFKDKFLLHISAY